MKYYFIKEAGPPRVMPDGILFTFAEKNSSVEISGGFINWEYTIPLNKGKYGIYYYLYSDKIEAGKHFYRYRVDGVWRNDPLQSNTAFDKNNSRVSCFFIEEDKVFFRSNPKKAGDGEYTFFYENKTARKVYFTCDYYGFNPTRFPLKRSDDGIWSITVELPKGGLYYNFIVDDKWETDPINYNVYFDREGRKMSYALIK